MQTIFRSNLLDNKQKYFHYDTAVNEIVSTIDPIMYSNIKRIICLDIRVLICPNPRKNRIPRPQNKFCIYRRNFQGKYSLKYGQVYFEDFISISKLASNEWNNEDDETKQIYEYLSYLAKQVHNKMFPEYAFKPRKKLFNNSQLQISHLNSFRSNLQSERNQLPSIQPIERHSNSYSINLPNLQSIFPKLSPIDSDNHLSSNSFRLPPINTQVNDFTNCSHISPVDIKLSGFNVNLPSIGRNFINFNKILPSISHQNSNNLVNSQLQTFRYNNTTQQLPPISQLLSNYL